MKLQVTKLKNTLSPVGRGIIRNVYLCGVSKYPLSCGERARVRGNIRKNQTDAEKKVSSCPGLQ